MPQDQDTSEDRPELGAEDLARQEAIDLPERTAMSLVDLPASTSGLGSGLSTPTLPTVPTPDTSGLTQLTGSQAAQGPYNPDITSTSTT